MWRGISGAADGDQRADTQGQVLAQVPGQTRRRSCRVSSTRPFPQRSSSAQGGNLFLETACRRGAPGGRSGNDGYSGFLIQQGYLESSNVDPVSAITSLITAQRAYEMNSKVITAANDTPSRPPIWDKADEGARRAWRFAGSTFAADEPSAARASWRRAPISSAAKPSPTAISFRDDLTDRMRPGIVMDVATYERPCCAPASPFGRRAYAHPHRQKHDGDDGRPRAAPWCMRVSAKSSSCRNSVSLPSGFRARDLSGAVRAADALPASMGGCGNP